MERRGFTNSDEKSTLTISLLRDAMQLFGDQVNTSLSITVYEPSRSRFTMLLEHSLMHSRLLLDIENFEIRRKNRANNQPPARYSGRLWGPCEYSAALYNS
mmetsp:Transcript_18391/g.45588  ORF Transcript_18391/g.45588 Transcript_18391/m.45588 type:complete len:101 (+) Transcript_18391:99-401(+)